MTEPSRALPQVNDLTRPFWEAANQGRLAIQRCGDCGYYNHPPKPLCDRCLSDGLSFEDVSGLGKVWTYTVMHQKSVAGFEESVPYVTALVELDEQPLLLLTTNLPGIEASDVRIGTRVQVSFQRLGDGIALPQFVAAPE
ncbi:MAG TPA: OB-fold domain-containing protein [Dehalococcoidia bacterium]|nr:OB-fold domain-containing protein [Dehalococcoidia bacterium]